MKLKSYINSLSAQGVSFWADKELLKWYDPNCIIDSKNRAILARYRSEILQLILGRKAYDFLRRYLNSVILGGNQNILPLLPDNSVDAFITDGPYGYGLMGKDWDMPISLAILKLLFRKVKPGGWLVLLSAPRQDVLLHNIDKLGKAGWGIHFSPIFWAYAQGFPKAKDIAKEIDKRKGVKPEIVGLKKLALDFSSAKPGSKSFYEIPLHGHRYIDLPITTPTSEEAKKLAGSYAGFQPKPAVEVILVAQKPFSEKSCTAQAMKDGKGCTYMDDCRIPIVGEKRPERNLVGQKSYASGQIPGSLGDSWTGSVKGRFPANLLVSDDILDNQEENKAVLGRPYMYPSKEYQSKGFLPVTNAPANYNDKGGNSRYFSLDSWADQNLPFLFVAKPSTKEKEFGLEVLDANKVNDGRHTPIDSPFQRGETQRRNTNPCVKPIKLMAYLVTMFSRPGDIIADPFAGSGSTCIAAKLLGRNYIGIEQSEEYHRIAEARLKAATDDNKYFQKLVAETKDAEDKIQEHFDGKQEPKPCFFTNMPDPLRQELDELAKKPLDLEWLYCRKGLTTDRQSKDFDENE